MWTHEAVVFIGFTALFPHMLGIYSSLVASGEKKNLILFISKVCLFYLLDY